ncbi:hypothetical protein A3F62_01795 [Candidatus Woesebacteria bacterium RIFCSPHIGHO2_12_FULL_44_11]|nr:MAG: hypothetical protein A3F62_01795 [Candidatus Woesebacteria bacterium RIFCSPHIGHO2_12_FULL_44_11]
MNKRLIKDRLSHSFHFYAPGKLNKISDVSGVKVGHYTLKNKALNTGITVVMPSQANIFNKKLAASVYVANAFGKFVGSTQVNELGNLETPIALTNTLAVNQVATFLKDYVAAKNPDALSINPVVGEINDSQMNDIRKVQFTYKNFLYAVKNTIKDLAEGSVGAGAGAHCLGYKGGIGSSSKIVTKNVSGLNRDYIVGVLVLTNFGGVLTIKGIPVGHQDKKFPFKEDFDQEKGSCIIVVATNAPLLPIQLQRLAKRAAWALGKVGSIFSNGSGDYSIAFSTNNANIMSQKHKTEQTISYIPNDKLSHLFWATQEAVEVAVYSALLHAEPLKYKNKLWETPDFNSIMKSLNLITKFQRQRTNQLV